MRGLVLKLLIRATGASGWDCKADLGDDLVWLQCGCKQIQEEIISFDSTYIARTLHHNIGLECQDYTGHVGGRVGVSNAATNRATIAHLLIADYGGAIAQQREM